MPRPVCIRWLLFAAWLAGPSKGALSDGAWGMSVEGPAAANADAGLSSERPVTAEMAVTFEMDVQPLLTRYGCNSGPCHGKSRGQNGFALSLLGFDAQMDHDALVQDGRGRRVLTAAPEESLLLRKATGQVPHGGGVRFSPESPAYALLREWIRQGAPRTPADAPQLVRVTLPAPHISLSVRQKQQLVVTAEYSDGSRRDVTDSSAFQSNDRAVVGVSEGGMVTAGDLPGETAIMARYMNNIAVCNVTIPLVPQPSAEEYRRLPRNNDVDELVWQKLQLLGMLPSRPAAEATFFRRAYLRVIGRIPTPDETQAYLSETRGDKRQRLIEDLLERPEYADFWANKWVDLLRPNPYRAGIKSVLSLDNWVRQAFRRNLPYDQLVRELLTAQGSAWRNGAVVVFRDRPETVEIASSVSQLFLGVRLECAKCHHHPFEIWSQDDFYGFAAHFARISHKGEGLSPPISGGEEMIFTNTTGTLAHGRTGELVAAKPLTGAVVPIAAEQDPREVLVEWMLAPQNPFFAKVMANRVWAEMMGRGIVEPVDDLRATNPAANEPLLEFLANDFRQHRYDIKHLIRTIALSHVFALSSEPTERNVADSRNFSRYYRQRLRAEVLLDAVNDILLTEDKFAALPAGSRAMHAWTHRSPSLFLDTFGRPDPNQDPPCERTSDSTTPQVLHIMNSPELQVKVSADTSRPAVLANTSLKDEQLLEQICLWVYARPMRDAEREVALRALGQAPNRRSGLEDLFWALLNTPEFLFID